ncbi:MAG: alkylresorcinol/alkylpyrone synthase [Alpinimonas sp.]
MTNIIAVAPVLAENVYEQSVIADELAPLVTSDRGKQAVMKRLHSSSKIATRHTILPLESYRSLTSFSEANDLFITSGTDLAEKAIRLALQKSNLVAADIDFFFFTSVTGISAPSLDAILAARLGMRSNVKRVPSFGLGCVAGASALARVHDYLSGHPKEIALVVSLELCSLTIQRNDSSMANLVASGLFGDGATAVILAGEESGLETGPGCPEIIATGSRLYPETTDVIGWNVGSSGFRIVLSAGVPAVIEQNLANDVANLLAPHGLSSLDVSVWVAHAGGPRVLEAFETSLDLTAGQLHRSWSSMNRVGNLSSSSVLHVLGDTLEAQDAAPGAYGLLFALGPGVSSEIILMKWPEAVAEDVAEADAETEEAA